MSPPEPAPATPAALDARVEARVERLFAAHHATLYRYLLRLTGDPDRAADAAQEAFVRALTAGALPVTEEALGTSDAKPKMSNVEPDAAGRPDDARHDAERAWLFRAATHVALDEARTAGRRRRLADAAPARVPVADAPADPHAALEARERHARVAAALAALPARDRAALLLREAGFAHREIALALGTTTGSVGTVLARALPRLAAALRAAVPGGAEAL